MPSLRARGWQMALMETGTVSEPRAETVQFYIGTDCARDSRFPFSGGDRFRATIVETVAGHHVVVLSAAACRVDVDATALVLDAPTTEAAHSIDDGDAGADPAATNGTHSETHPNHDT